MKHIMKFHVTLEVIILILFFIPMFCFYRASGVCKHVGAILWYIEREVQLGNNKTCISKKQKWDVPSKKNVRLHQAATLKKIDIKKAVSSKIIGAPSTPKELKITNEPGRKLTETDIDTLAEITNGRCGLVVLKRRKTNDLTNTASISEEIHVTTSPEVSLPKTIDEISKDVGPCNFAEFVSSIKMIPEQQKLLINKTKDQSMSNIWFEQHKDRITASILKSAAVKVDSNNKLINRDKSRSILSKVCGYYPRCKSKATDWGISNEPGARSTNVKTIKKKHQNFKVEETAFYVHVEHPYIGASPDGLVECDCHGPGILETKCPWSH